MTESLYNHTNPTEADAAMQGTRDASINKTIATAERTAKCPVCNEHPTDCICYGRFGKATLKALPAVKTWRPDLMKEPINP